MTGDIKATAKQIMSAMQEWTGQTVFGLMGSDYGHDGWKREKLVADAHNAELAAERKRREQSEEDIADAIDYLDGNMAVLELHDGELCEKLISAVSAKFGHAADELPTLRQQLLAALAAIEKHNKRAQWPNCYKIKVDRSALDEHDAEVREKQRQDDWDELGQVGKQDQAAGGWAGKIHEGDGRYL